MIGAGDDNIVLLVWGEEDDLGLMIDSSKKQNADAFSL